MRAFIAIDLPKDLKEQIAQFQKELKKANVLKAKFVEKENLHLALKFLGEISKEDVDKISEKLKEICKKCKPFVLSLKGLGAFPTENFVRVIWIGVDNGSIETKELNRQINKALGLKEGRDFIGHITLARIKAVSDKKKLAGIFEKYKEKEFGSFQVKSIKLIESKLTREGPIYSVIEEFRLNP